MRWSATIVVAAMLATGCNNTAPSNDPFAPRLLPSTRVPPPATGAAGSVDGSYYNSPTPGPLPTPAPTALPSGTTGSLDAPPNGPFRASPAGTGSFTPNQSTSVPKSARGSSTRTHVDHSVTPASHVTAASASSQADDGLELEDEDGDEEGAEQVDEAAHSSGLRPTSARFSKRSGSSRVVDIMDLPPVGHSR